MTRFVSPETEHLLHLVGEALGSALRASLDGDVVAARRVLRTGARRRSAARAAQQAIGGSEAHRRQASAQLFVSDVAQVSDLVDHLARQVATGRDSGDVTAAQREAILLLARFGEERLHQLADEPVGPEMSREYVRCGQCLFDVLDRLADTETTTGCCAALTASILRASRHAALAA